jgi:hypothetical protein
MERLLSRNCSTAILGRAENRVSTGWKAVVHMAGFAASCGGLDFREPLLSLNNNVAWLSLVVQKVVYPRAGSPWYI